MKEIRPIGMEKHECERSDKEKTRMRSFAEYGLRKYRFKIPKTSLFQIRVRTFSLETIGRKI